MTKGIDAKDSDRTLCPSDVSSLAIEATKLLACSTFNKLGYSTCKFCKKSLPWVTILGKSSKKLLTCFETTGTSPITTNNNAVKKIAKDKITAKFRLSPR